MMAGTNRNRAGVTTLALGRRAVLLGGSAGLLAACSGQMRFPVTEQAQSRLVDDNITIIRMTPDNIAEHRTPRYRVGRHQAVNPPPGLSGYTYRVGPGDVLHVQVWTDPERTQTAAAQTGNDRGITVNEHGEIFYPYVGSIRASGRSVDELRRELTERLRTYINDPQVDVSVMTFNAHQATITGAVGAPGTITLTNVPKRLLEIVNAASPAEDADLSRISLRRRGTPHIVDLRAFVERGDSANNPIILPGDLIHISTQDYNKVFTFGEIATREIPLSTEDMTLTEVLAEVGGINRVRADSRGVFVFRRTPETPDGFIVYQFDIRSATALVLATYFEMAPLDIVFVTNDPITRWNDTVGSVITPITGLIRIRALAEEF